MKVKAIAEGYYNDEIIKKGRIFNIKGDKVPSWCTLVNGIESRKPEEDVQEPQTPAVPANDEGNAPAAPEVENAGPEAKEPEETPEEVKEPEETPVEENAPEDEASPEAVSYLNRLIDEGIEKGVLIEDTDKKSIKQQIDELEKRLGRK